ncbi:MAG: hypothetical protein A2W91_12305 [Bacteroidetes bacterium GWF2_38_335]|nr:MAG: hypothetical protein A2W91_12305 [Bacteroidetes bacterium GWF2_38_335]OFY76951.1 MAG: hypothetical protein A2281_00420 [Bacteroidetes bacterium RIFOXYA12_FULL_38_20]HBS86805.1 hypothetical protein [Bacteroidales bacterium]
MNPRNSIEIFPFEKPLLQKYKVFKTTKISYYQVEKTKSNKDKQTHKQKGKSYLFSSFVQSADYI